MATVKTIFSGNNKLVINVTGVFSAADETDVVIIDRSTLTGPDGVNIPNKVRIDEVTALVGVGFDYVMLEFDDDTDEVIEYFQGQGLMQYFTYGGKSMATDPGTATEGDVLLTTSGGAAADTYSLLIACTLKN